MAKFYIIYKTTCSVSGRFYLGMHETTNLDDGYLGSGKHIQSSIMKHGKDAHAREILAYAPNKKELRLLEATIVTEELLKDSRCMNLLKGGQGGFSAEMRLKSHEALRIKLQDPEYAKSYKEKAAKSGSMVSAEGRAACSDALKAKYQDPAFKENQKAAAKLATASSWSPEARAKRAANRAAKRLM